MPSTLSKVLHFRSENSFVRKIIANSLEILHQDLEEECCCEAETCKTKLRTKVEEAGIYAEIRDRIKSYKESNKADKDD